MFLLPVWIIFFIFALAWLRLKVYLNRPCQPWGFRFLLNISAVLFLYQAFRADCCRYWIGIFKLGTQNAQILKFFKYFLFESGAVFKCLHQVVLLFGNYHLRSGLGDELVYLGVDWKQMFALIHWLLELALTCLFDFRKSWFGVDYRCSLKSGPYTWVMGAAWLVVFVPHLLIVQHVNRLGL